MAIHLLEIANETDYEKYYSCAYCSPIEITWTVLLCVIGIPFNAMVVYTLLASPVLRQNFVSIYVTVITGVNIQLFLSNIILFFTDGKLTRTQHNDAAYLERRYLMIRLQLAMIGVGIASVNWITVVFSALRAVRLVYPHSWMWLYSHVTTVCVCLCVMGGAVLWYKLSISPWVNTATLEDSVKDERDEEIFLFIYSPAARIELSLAIFLVPMVLINGLNVFVVCSFKFSVFTSTRITDCELHRRIVRNMGRFTLNKLLQSLLLLTPFALLLIYLKDFSEDIPIEHQQIIILCVFFAHVTDSMVNSLKYRRVWGLFQTELNSNFKYIWSLLRMKRNKMKAKMQLRARLVTMLIDDISRKKTTDDVRSQGTLASSDHYHPVLDMFVTKPTHRKGGRKTVKVKKASIAPSSTERHAARKGVSHLAQHTKRSLVPTSKDNITAQQANTTAATIPKGKSSDENNDENK